MSNTPKETRPSIAVWQDKYVKGVSSVNGPHVDKHGNTFEPVAADRFPLSVALQTEHPTDAHMTCYALLDDEGVYSDFPLLRKQALPSIRKAGGDVHLAAIGLDWDTPGHVPLDEAHLAYFLERLEAAISADPRLGDWYSWYTSRHGTRIFYLLDKPVPVDEGERYIVSVIKAFKDQDLILDESCRDWTRRFRLPLVVRDGQHTKDEPLHAIEIEEGRTLDITQFPKSSHKALARVRTFTRREVYPDQEECYARLHETGDKGKEVATRFFAAARKILKNTDYYDVLVSQTAYMPDYGKHDYLLKMFGIVVPKLLRHAYAQPEDIFALIYEPLCAWDPDTYIHDPHKQAWDMIQHIYEQEASKYNEEQEREAEKEETAESILRKMSEGMKQWNDAPELASKEQEVVDEFVKGHLFANFGKFYFPMNEHGRFVNYCVEREQLITHIRKGHLDGLVETWKLSQGGDMQGVSAVEIANKHSTIIQKVESLPQLGEGGHVRDMDGWSPELVLPMYRRSPFLAAQYNEYVDGWLRCFFGDHYEDAAKWIGYALAFEEGPICAMSIMGRSGTGKKLLAMGLSECLERPFIIPAKSLGAKHAEELTSSPFLLVNEAWPAMLGSPSDRFKELTAGDAIHVEPKFKPTIQVTNPLRIIFTANNHDLLYDLTRGRDLTPEDKRAIGERLYHVDISDDAVEYLWQLGGPGFTAKEGERWIRGDSGQASNFVVARHFLWLYENRPERDKRERFCMMGNCHEQSAEMFHMVSQSDTVPMVMRALVLMFERGGVVGKKHTLVRGGKAYVTRYGVLDVIRKTLEETVQERSLENCLRSLAKTLVPLYHDNKEFLELDVAMVNDYAMRWGMDCPTIRGLLEGGK